MDPDSYTTQQDIAALVGIHAIDTLPKGGDRWKENGIQRMNRIAKSATDSNSSMCLYSVYYNSPSTQTHTCNCRRRLLYFLIVLLFPIGIALSYYYILSQNRETLEKRICKSISYIEWEMKFKRNIPVSRYILNDNDMLNILIYLLNLEAII